jgi:hypothetical protein
MASLRAAIVGFIYYHIGVLNMLYPILNYIFECNYNITGGSTKRIRSLSSVFEEADSQANGNKYSSAA